MTANGVRHFLDLTDIPKPVLAGLIDRSRALKAARAKGQIASPLAGKTLAMVFDKPSTRTRVSFDVAMRQLGGEAILLTAQEMQLGRGETLADTARVLSRYVDVIMIRILDHEAVHELARHATIPVINGLTRRSHPCQILADVMTYGKSVGRSADAPLPGPATPTTCWRAGCTPPNASISSCGWRHRRSCGRKNG